MEGSLRMPGRKMKKLTLPGAATLLQRGSCCSCTAQNLVDAGVLGRAGASQLQTNRSDDRQTLVHLVHRCQRDNDRKRLADMSTREIRVLRFSVISSRKFHDVVSAIQGAIGHPNMSTLVSNMSAAKTFTELEAVVREATGPSGLMEFTRFDLGEVLRKRNGAQAPQSVRLVLGNPIIMSSMVQHVPDAGSYAPVTVLVDERADGVHLSYDRMATFLTPYGNSEALEVAQGLDVKVEALLMAAATGK